MNSPLRKSLSLILALALPVATLAQTVSLSVNASQSVRIVDERVFGVNTACWDNAFNNTETLPLLQAIDIHALRFPGGSTSDAYQWQSNKTYDTNTGLINTWSYATNFDDFARVARPLNAQVFITVNYGSGTAQEAADWVTYSNVTKGYGFKYWEVGNENYGSWEYDTHPVKNDPETYAASAKDFITKMKAVDPTIKVGVVVIDGEDSYASSARTAVTNPRTGISHKGWTPVMLAKLKVLGVTPDFVIFHRYPSAPGSESDATLLAGRSQSGSTWAQDAAGLRQQVNDYLGSIEGPKVELTITENNSVYSNTGKQTTSLVNGLFFADSLGSVLQTEFNSLVWWCLRNGPQDKTNNNSSALYGWRNYGDYGIVAPGNATETPVSTPYPTYYMMKLLSHFARGGDTVVQATSPNALLAIYSAKRTDGSLSLLVINKDPTNTLNATVALTGFVPGATATTYTYGKPQDTAAQTGSGSTDIATGTMSIGGTTFSASFASYSATVISLPSPNVAPVFTYQPASTTVSPGASVTFAVAASGTPTFQWKKNGVTISGATSNTYTILNVTTGDSGNYTAVATNSAGSATSDTAILTVNVAPAITTQPASQTITTGSAVTFTVAASGSPTPTYQWKKGGVAISGATGSSYTIAATILGDAESYTVVVTNSLGSATSNVATLAVGTPPAGFDVAGYFAHNPTVAAIYGTNSYGAWLYYHDHGIYDGEVYDDLFRVEEYLSLYPELFTLFGNDLGGALVHWLTQGSIEGRLGRIPLLFSAQGYFDRNPDVATAVGGNAVLAWQHYWAYGIYEGRAYDEELRVFEYLAVNADLTAAFVSDWRAAALHWMRYGRTEGRLGRLPLIFNVTVYLNRSPDVAAVWGTNPTTVFLHYWTYGIDEGRTFDDEFRPAEYLALNPDLAAVFGTDLRGAFKHWVRYGKTEGRPGKNP